MVRENDLRAIGDEEISIDGNSRLAQSPNFLQKSHGVEHHAIADDASAPGAQYSAGNQLQDEFLAVNDDGMAGVVAAGIARDDREVLRKNVDNLALALVAPLGTDDYRGLAFFQFPLREEDSRTRADDYSPGVAHSLAPATHSQKATWDKSGRRCVLVSLTCWQREWQRSMGAMEW
jgi:hypothetical protein